MTVKSMWFRCPVCGIIRNKDTLIENDQRRTLVCPRCNVDVLEISPSELYNLFIEAEKINNNLPCEEIMGKDPWKHRSTGMRCRTCMWFVEKVIDPKIKSEKIEYDVKIIGRCRRHAPTMNGYPVVFHDDWCGDHRLNENAV